MTSSNPTLLVMAAGMGSRFGGAKQIEPVGPNGETLLDYSVYDALRAGFDRVVFVIRRDFDVIFRERVGSRFERRVQVDYVFQELDRLPATLPIPPGRTKPWGTGHAVWCAANAIHGPFTVINADDFYGRDAFVQLARFFTGKTSEASGVAHFAMAGYQLAYTLSEHGPVSRGVCQLDARGRLIMLREMSGIERRDESHARAQDANGAETVLPLNTPVSMNCWGFTPAFFSMVEKGLTSFLRERGADAKAEYFLSAAVTKAIASGEAHVDVLPTAASWFGITHREDTPRVVAAIAHLIESGEYPPSLWA